MPAASRLPDRILALLQGKKATPLDVPTLARRLRVPPGVISRTLTALEKEGRVARVRHDRWITAGSADLITGTIQFHPKGFAFVTPAEGEGPDLRIDAEDTATALHGDLVVARLQRPSFTGRRRSDGGERPRGRVIR
ncbi:MAG: ribonuclease, partial [Verrucomicrobiota bacterium]